MARLLALLALLSLACAPARALQPSSDALLAASAAAKWRLTDANAALQALSALLAGGAAAALQGNASVAALAAEVAGALSALTSAAPGVQAALAPLAGWQPLGAWSKVDQGEALALDVPFAQYAASQLSYGQALAAALAQCLGAAPETVVVVAFQPSTAGTALVFLDLLLAGASSSSTAVVAEAASIQSLFESPGGVGAAAKPQLVAAMQAFGLPVSAAYYGDQNLPPPSPSPPRPPRPPKPPPPSPSPPPPPSPSPPPPMPGRNK